MSLRLHVTMSPCTATYNVMQRNAMQCNVMQRNQSKVMCACTCVYTNVYIPVVPHKAVAEVSKIGNL